MTWPGGLSRRLFGLAAACLVLGQAHVVAASMFTINPTKVVLTARAPSAVVTLRNESDQPLRFQLSTFVWNQTPDGQMDLTPTEDIVFFPSLFSIAPREERKVRVGVTAGWAETEKSYRLFIDELPSPQEPGAGTGLRVLTRMGIPIFMPPSRASGSAALEGLGLTANGLAFSVRNTGNVHFTPEGIIVKGLDAAGAAVFEHPVEAWYILAGGVREFSLRVPPPGCASTKAIHVEVRLDGGVLQERLETPTGACTP